MKEKYEVKDQPAFHSRTFDEAVIGFPDDSKSDHEDVVKIVVILEDAGISRCFIEEDALVYYGSGRRHNICLVVAHSMHTSCTRNQCYDRVLCIPDDKHTHATELSNSHEILVPALPSPIGGVPCLLRIFPRFKVVGQTDFWLLVTASYCRFPCSPSNIVKSLGNLPFPKLPIYAQVLLDTQNIADLEELINGMNLYDEWGEENLDIDGEDHVEWAQRRKDTGRATNFNPMFTGLSTVPTKGRVQWQESVRYEMAEARECGSDECEKGFDMMRC